MAGQVIPVELTIYEDRSFSFITKQPPAAELIKQAAGIEKGSGVPNRDKVASLTHAQVSTIAERRWPTSTRTTSTMAMRIIAGTARSMGVEVERMRRSSGKRYREAAGDVRPRRAEYTPAEAIRPPEVAPRREVRRDRRGRRSGWGSTRASPIRRSAARSRCPHGTGKTVRVAVFAAGEKAREAARGRRRRRRRRGARRARS